MKRDARPIFDDALRMPQEERAAFLEAACGADAALRAEVEALLAAGAEGFTAGPMVQRANAQVTADVADVVLVAGAAGHEHPGQVIGRYTLVQPIGEGGFGSVWMAEQREPVTRRVALKVIKLGMDTRQVIARFEAERQALAMMDHPNIAKVLDAGSTGAGRPYFVMEYIKGVPILEYCDAEELDTKARLHLFMSVCHAIQHAHQKGIIHRDIKPSNVLVTLQDGTPVPKVIDFGIAKATGAELTTRTLLTEHRQMIGTPAYMSPEQADMSGLDIDTRSDIYSLGVLLYELLTGTTPFTVEDLLSKGYAEMMRVFREVEPHKPSTRLSSLGETGTRTALRRHVADPQKLSTLLRGDLDWIVMRCLEKDRQRRYETANALALDIQRHLTDQPVMAGPPSATYRLGKFVKRNRGRVIAGGVLAAALVLGVVGTTAGMVWALKEKDRADASAETARLELARATEIKRLITEMLTSVNPAEARGADTRLLKGILDDAAARLAQGEITDELIAAELHHLVGGVYWNLGLYSEAERHTPAAVEIRSRLLGEEHPDTLTSMSNLAALQANQGRYAEAEALCQKTLEISKRVLGEENAGTLRSMNILAGLYVSRGRYAEAEPLRLRTLEIQRRVLGEEHTGTLLSVRNLGWLYQQQGRYAEAEPLFQRALEISRHALGEEHPDTLASMAGLAGLYWAQGRAAEAEPYLRGALESQRRLLGVEHPDTVRSMGILAIVYLMQARHDEAEALFKETLEIQRRVLGEEHPYTLMAMGNLAESYSARGRFDLAEPLLLRTLETHRRLLGEEHPDTLSSMTYLAEIYTAQDRFDLAEPMLLQALDGRRRVLGEDHPHTAYSLNSLSRLYLRTDRAQDARRLAEDACRDEDRAGAEIWKYLDTLALAQHATGDSAAAVETQRRALSLMAGGHPERADYERRLAEYEAAAAGKEDPPPAGGDR